MDEAQLEHAIEAILFASGEPVSIALVVAILVSNLPESIGSAADLLRYVQSEQGIVLAKSPETDPKVVADMVKVADFTRQGFMNGDISTVMSPRTVITWAQNAEIFKDVGFAFRVTFVNKCDELERSLVAEQYQRAFGVELKESAANIVLEATA